MQTNYVLDGKTPVPVDDIGEWGKWWSKADRRVALWKEDGVSVSTVFLGIDHSFGEGPPLLFETMVFGLESLEGEQDRCSTWEQAEQMHKLMVARVLKAQMAERPELDDSASGGTLGDQTGSLASS